MNAPRATEERNTSGAKSGPLNPRIGFGGWNTIDQQSLDEPNSYLTYGQFLMKQNELLFQLVGSFFSLSLLSSFFLSLLF